MLANDGDDLQSFLQNNFPEALAPYNVAKLAILTYVGMNS